LCLERQIGVCRFLAVRISVCPSVVPLVPKGGGRGQKEDLVEGAENAVRNGVCLSVVPLVPLGKEGHGDDLAEGENLFEKTEKPLERLCVVSNQTALHILPPKHQSMVWAMVVFLLFSLLYVIFGSAVGQMMRGHV